MKKIFKRFFIGLLGLLIILLIVYRDLVAYGWGQARGQWHVINNTRPVLEVLADSTTSPAIREKLLLVGEVREFAMNELGLAHSDNYTTFFDQKGKDLMFVVTACEPYRLKAKTWDFPLVGTFPYKGYFDSIKAEQERGIWEEAGFDTRVRVAGGWSTLGYFTDPILSKMLNRSEGKLAELIIHELTHATLFVKDSVEFNENLATFIGEKGAEQFLIKKYGEGNPQLVTYQAGRENGRVFANHIIRGAHQLDSMYSLWDQSPIDTAQMAERKTLLIQEITGSVDTLTLQGASSYAHLFEKSLPNNAYFMSFLRYRQKQNTFESWYEEEFGSNLQRFLNEMKNRYPSL